MQNKTLSRVLIIWWIYVLMSAHCVYKPSWFSCVQSSNPESKDNVRNQKRNGPAERKPQCILKCVYTYIQNNTWQNNDYTLCFLLEVSEGHQMWYNSICSVWFPISVL